eukprot:COSAG06_NODE_19689_length_826_cov_1.916094_1_plen_89_part_10
MCVRTGTGRSNRRKALEPVSQPRRAEGKRRKHYLHFGGSLSREEKRSEEKVLFPSVFLARSGACHGKFSIRIMFSDEKMTIIGESCACF